MRICVCVIANSKNELEGNGKRDLVECAQSACAALLHQSSRPALNSSPPQSINPRFSTVGETQLGSDGFDQILPFRPCQVTPAPSGGGNILPKFLLISFFRRASRLLRRFRTPDTPTRKFPVYIGILPCLILDGLELCKSVSRSDLVPISFWMLSHIPWTSSSRFTSVHLVLERFRQKGRTSVFVLFA